MVDNVSTRCLNQWGAKKQNRKTELLIFKKKKQANLETSTNFEIIFLNFSTFPTFPAFFLSSTMPKTRKPRGGAAAPDQQAVALEKAKEKLSPEDQEKYASLLEDFDKQVEKKIKEIENEAKAKAENFYRECMVEIMRLPTSIRNLNWEATAPYLMEPEEEVEEEKAPEETESAPAKPAKSGEDKENDEIRQVKKVHCFMGKRPFFVAALLLCTALGHFTSIFHDQCTHMMAVLLIEIYY